jgi:hypothetical protein
MKNRYGRNDLKTIIASVALAASAFGGGCAPEYDGVGEAPAAELDAIGGVDVEATAVSADGRLSPAGQQPEGDARPPAGDPGSRRDGDPVGAGEEFWDKCPCGICIPTEENLRPRRVGQPRA